MDKKISYYIAPLILIVIAGIVAFFIIKPTSPTNYQKNDTFRPDSAEKYIIITPKGDPWHQKPVQLKSPPKQSDNCVKLEIESPFEQGISNYILNDDYDLYIDGSRFAVDSFQTIDNKYKYRLVLMVDRSYSANMVIDDRSQSKHGLFNQTLRYFWDNLKYRDIDIEVYFFQSRRFIFVNYGPLLFGPYNIKTFEDLKEAVDENDKSLGGTPLIWAIKQVAENLNKIKNDSLQTHVVILTDGLDSHGGDYTDPELHFDNIFFHSFAGFSEYDRKSERFKDFREYIINSGGLLSTDWDSLYSFVDKMSQRAFADFVLYAKPVLDVKISPNSFKYKKMSVTVEERPFVDRIYFDNDGDWQIPDNRFKQRFEPFVEKIAQRLANNPSNMLVITGYLSYREYKTKKFDIASKREKFIKQKLLAKGIEDNRIVMASTSKPQLAKTDFREVSQMADEKLESNNNWYREMPCDEFSGAKLDKSDAEMIAEHSRSVLIQAIPYYKITKVRWQDNRPISYGMEDLIDIFCKRFENLESYVKRKEFKTVFNEINPRLLREVYYHLEENPESYLVYYCGTENPIVAENRLKFLLKQGLGDLDEKHAALIIERSFLISSPFCTAMPAQYDKPKGTVVCQNRLMMESSLTFRPQDTTETKLEMPDMPASFRIRKFDTSMTVSVQCSLALADKDGKIISPVISRGRDKGTFHPGILPIGAEMGEGENSFKAAVYFNWKSDAYNLECDAISFSDEFKIVSENISVKQTKLIEQYNFDTYEPKSSYFLIRIPQIVEHFGDDDSITLKIYGNTCPIGSDIRNKELSAQRVLYLANKIRKYTQADIHILGYPYYSRQPVFKKHGTEESDTLDFSMPENRDIARSAFIEYNN